MFILNSLYVFVRLLQYLHVCLILPLFFSHCIFHPLPLLVVKMLVICLLWLFVLLYISVPSYKKKHFLLLALLPNSLPPVLLSIHPSVLPSLISSLNNSLVGSILARLVAGLDIEPRVCHRLTRLNIYNLVHGCLNFLLKYIH